MKKSKEKLGTGSYKEYAFNLFKWKKNHRKIEVELHACRDTTETIESDLFQNKSAAYF